MALRGFLFSFASLRGLRTDVSNPPVRYAGEFSNLRSGPAGSLDSGLPRIVPTLFLRPEEPFRSHSRRRDPGLRGPLGSPGLAVLYPHHQRRRDDPQIREESWRPGAAHVQDHGGCGLCRSAAQADGHHRQGPFRVAGGGRGILLQSIHQDHTGRQAAPGRSADLRPGGTPGPLPRL